FPSGARWELARGNPHETRVTNREITRGQTPSGMYRCGNRPAHGFGIFGRIEWAFGELLGYLLQKLLRQGSFLLAPRPDPQHNLGNSLQVPPPFHGLFQLLHAKLLFSMDSA